MDMHLAHMMKIIMQMIFLFVYLLPLNHQKECCKLSADELRGSVHGISPKGRNKLVRLVGEKCMISVALDGWKYDVLWDTGAQVSLVEGDWFKKHFPEKRVRKIQELFDQDLVITSASGRLMRIIGWVELNMKVDKGEGHPVPFVVTSAPIAHPVVGFNVIPCLLEDNHECNFSSLFQGKPQVSEALVQTLRKEQDGEVGVARSGKRNIMVNPGACEILNCFVRSGGAFGGEVAIFTPGELGDREGVQIPESLVKLSGGSICSFNVPVKNNSNSILVIRKGSCLGNLISVKSVVTLRPPETYVTETRTSDRETSRVSGGQSVHKVDVKPGQ
jgi:hypothetical protein